jgi:hypothetical protein
MTRSWVTGAALGRSQGGAVEQHQDPLLVDIPVGVGAGRRPLHQPGAEQFGQDGVVEHEAVGESVHEQAGMQDVHGDPSNS